MLDQFFGPIFDFFARQGALGRILTIGLAVLPLALLVLMRTRWGQAKPLSKCIFLSVFAHLLLVGYASMMRLSYDFRPSLGEEDGVMVRLDNDVSDTSPESTQTPDVDRPLRPWETFPVTEPPPELVEPSPLPIPETPAELSVQSQRKPVAEIPRPTFASDAAEVPASTEPPIAPQPVEETSIVSQPVPAAELLPPIQEEPDRRLDEPADPLHQAADAAPGPDRLGPIEPDASAGASPPAAPVAYPIPPGEIGEVPPAPQRRPDGQPLPERYQGRVAENRLAAAQRFGGNRQTEEAVEDALRWLASCQEADGRWNPRRFGAGVERKIDGHDRLGAGADADTGITGLALLAMLGAGNTHLDGPYRANVQRGLEFILNQQRSDGCLAGDAGTFAKMYCHSIASLAVSEDYAMTGDPRLLPYLESAVRYTTAAQHGPTGGWRYQPNEPGDTSQFGWQVMALKSAQAGGVTLPAATDEGMRRFLASVSSGTHGGLGSYQPAGRVTRTMTAEAMVCRIFLQTDPSSATRREAIDYLMQELPGQGFKPNLYYYYYGTLALYQLQDEASWSRWNAAMQTALLASRRTDGTMAGSWDPDACIWGGYGGRIYTTAMAALCLEVYYRYLPIYEKTAGR